MSDLRQAIKIIVSRDASFLDTNQKFENIVDEIFAAFEKMLPEELETKSFIASGWNQYRKEVLERLE